MNSSQFFTTTEIDLLYKFANLIEKYSITDWSCEELARRWKVSKTTIIAFFRKLKIKGFLEEIRNRYHEVLRSLTNEAIELIKSGAFTAKKLFEEKLAQYRSGTDPVPINYPVKEEVQVIKDKELGKEDFSDPHIFNSNNLLYDNETVVQDPILKDLDHAVLMRLELQTEQIKALSTEEYRTYNKPILNASAFMNNCINRALNLVKRINRPQVERNEVKTVPEPVEVVNEPKTQRNTIPNEIKKLHGKVLSNGWNVRVFDYQITLWRGTCETRELLEIKINDYDFEKMIKEHILKHL